MKQRTENELSLGFARVRAAQECRNLMGRYSFYHTAMRHEDFLNECWANRDDCKLVMPWGVYRGIKGVRVCYLKDHGDRSYPEVRDSVTFKGGFFQHCADTCVLEVSGDGKTAKGVWLSPGHETATDPFTGEVSAEWSWSKYAVDFILDEGGKWRFWHMRLYPIFKADYYMPWTEYPQPDPSIFPFKSFEPLPVPNWQYSPDTVYPPDEPEPPLPYYTFDDVGPCC